MKDLMIIGAGPVGLYAGFYAGMRNLSFDIIDSLPTIGGQLISLYPEKYIYDVGGFPKIKAKDLINNLKKQVNNFDYNLYLNSEVIKINKISNGFEIITDNKKHLAKAILLTIGNGSFSPRKIGIENEDKLKNLSYYVDDFSKYRDKDVVILGGGDSALDWSNELKDIANVSLVHRRDEFRAHEKTVSEVKNSNVNILTPYIIDQIDNNNITIKNVKSNETKKIKYDEIIASYGFITNLKFVKDMDFELDKNMILVNRAFMSNHEGIFACGDCATYENKVKLISVGFGEAVMAINSIKKYLFPNEKLKVLHSTTSFEKEK